MCTDAEIERAFAELDATLDARLYRMIQPGSAVPVNIETTAMLVRLCGEAFTEIRRLRHEGYERDHQEECRIK